MMLICSISLRRLIMASADAQLRQDMNVEDEYFQAIEDRDTAIMSRDKVIRRKTIRSCKKISRALRAESAALRAEPTIGSCA